MGDTKMEPRSLTSEERAWCDAIAVALCSSGNYSAAGAISEAVTLGLPERRALFGQPASEGGKVECENCGLQIIGNLSDDLCRCPVPASEPAKVECPNCKESIPNRNFHKRRDNDPGSAYDCKPAQPEPVAAEMPEAVREAARILRVASKGYVGFTVSFLNSKADALESFWRAHAAQPAKVTLPAARVLIRQVQSITEALCAEGFPEVATALSIRAADASAELDAAEGRK